MKKITLLIIALISCLGFSQNLVTNGDFQTGVATPWTGNAANVVDLGAANFVNQANVTAAGNPWDVNLSQNINLVSGKTYKLTFDAFTDTATGTRTILSGLGQNNAPYNSSTSTTTLTSTLQTFTYLITITYGDAVGDRVLFDMGAGTGYVFIDNVSVVEVLPLIQDFETPVTYSNLAAFSGSSVSVVADPVSGTSNGQVLKGIQGPGGDIWQGVEFVQTAKKAKLTTNKTMTVDVYCSQAFNILAKVEQGGTAPISATGQAYTTPGQWQTLTFNFAVPMDNTAVANGEYQKIIFFGNWKSTNDGFNNPLVPLTFYINNIRAEETIIPVTLPLIQNFETPNTYTSLASFSGSTATVVNDPVTGGTNGLVLQGVQGPGGDIWQGIEFVQTEKKAKLTTNKTMTVDVYCSQAFNLLAKVEQGGTGPNSANGQAYTTPGQWQTLTFNFAVPMDNTATANGEYQKIIFFGNWKSTNDGFNSPLVPLTFYLDNVRAEEAPVVPVTDPAPMTPAPTPPARPTADVVSAFSDAYTNEVVSAWGPDWGPSSTTIVDNPISSNPTKKINLTSGKIFTGIVLGSYHDLTQFTHFHMDYWIPSPVLTGQTMSIKLSNHAAQNGETSAIQTLPVPQGGQWVSLDIPLADFVAASNPSNLARNSIKEIVITAARADNQQPLYFYFDNLYFHKNTLLSNDNFALSTVKLYPNPTSNTLNIEAQNTIQSIAIYDILGQEILNKEINSLSTGLDVSNLSNGVYMIKTVIGGVNSSTKFIKE
jgi:hypothetical protein